MNSLAQMMKEVSIREVEKRTERIREQIRTQKEQLMQSLQDKIQEFNLRKKNKFTSYQESILDDLEKFKSAGQNIAVPFFPVLDQDLIIQCLSQEEIFKQLRDLRTAFDKAWQVVVRRLLRQQDTANTFQETEESPWSTGKTKRIHKVKVQDRIKGKNCKIPVNTSHVLQKWLLENFTEPYPSKLDKREMSLKSGLSMKQVNNWFINARERIVKKYVVRQMSKIVKKKNLRKEDEEAEEDK